MANYATLKAAIVAAIKQNGNNEITGNLLQQQLLAMVNSLGVGYQYAGIATPATNPGTPDQNVFYLASTAGTYTNFGAKELPYGKIAILSYNGNWSIQYANIPSSELLTNSIGLFINDDYAVLANGNYQLVYGLTSTDLISVDNVKYIKGVLYDSVHQNGTSGVACIAWYDENKNFISYYDKTIAATYYDGNLFFPIVDIAKADFPANAKYFRCCGLLEAISDGIIILDVGGIYGIVKESLSLKEDVEANTENIEALETKSNAAEKTIGGSYSNIVTVLAGANITFLLPPNASGHKLYGRITLIVNNLTGVSALQDIVIEYYKPDGTPGYLNVGSANQGKVKKGFIHTYYINKEWRLNAMYFNGVVNPISNNAIIDFTITADFIANRPINYFVPKEIFLLRDDNVPYTSTRDNIRIYPHNMVDVDDTDFSIGVAVIGQRSGEKFVVPQIADTKFPVRVINQDKFLGDFGDIAVRVANPSAPSSALFILTIGDSLMYGANMDYHGCINNELSRLFNGVGKAIANGAAPIGYNNVHIIGTMESGAADAPVKFEGRGGWSVRMYLDEPTNNPFYNPTTQKFDLDYYLTQNGFYTDGVAADGSNLVIPIMLNWNTDPLYSNEFETNYAELIENIHASHPNAKILLLGCNCPPRNVFATYTDSYVTTFPQTQAYVKRRVIEYENKLQALAEQYSYCYHVPILPFYNWQNAFKYFDTVLPTPRDTTNILRVYGDYAHPNLMGYGQICDIIFNAICYLFLT